MRSYIHIRLIIKFLIIIAFFIIYILPCLAQDRGYEHPALDAKNCYEEYGDGNNSVLDFYQKWISPVKGENKCPMYPSCSQYAKIAFNVLPWYKAYPLSLERLSRCGNELYLYPTIRLNGKIRWYDPVAIKQSKNEGEIPKDSLQSYYKRDNYNIVNPYTQNVYDEGFADYLFKEGEYYRAVIEYYRLTYITSDSNKKAYLFRNIGLCYYHGADYDGFISFVNEHNLYFSLNPNIRAEMTLYLARSYYHLNDYQKAISTLEWSKDRDNNLFFNDNQLVSAISHARIFEWQKAIEKLELINNDYPGKTPSESITLSLKNFNKLPQKSPFWAGMLSAIIPGTGYVYCNRKGTGITSFIVNGLLLLTIREAVIKENYWFAGTVSFFGIGWDIGNIKGSKDAAHVYNANIRNKFIRIAL